MTRMAVDMSSAHEALLREREALNNLQVGWFVVFGRLSLGMDVAPGGQASGHEQHARGIVGGARQTCRLAGWWVSGGVGDGLLNDLLGLGRGGAGWTGVDGICGVGVIVGVDCVLGNSTCIHRTVGMMFRLDATVFHVDSDLPPSHPPSLFLPSHPTGPA